MRLDDPVRAELRVRTRSERSITWQCELFRGNDDTAAVQVLLTQVSVRIDDALPSAVPLPERLTAAIGPASTVQEDRRP